MDLTWDGGRLQKSVKNLTQEVTADISTVVWDTQNMENS